MRRKRELQNALKSCGEESGSSILYEFREQRKKVNHLLQKAEADWMLQHPEQVQCRALIYLNNFAIKREVTLLGTAIKLGEVICWWCKGICCLWSNGYVMDEKKLSTRNNYDIISITATATSCLNPMPTSFIIITIRETVNCLSCLFN